MHIDYQDDYSEYDYDNGKKCLLRIMYIIGSI